MVEFHEAQSIMQLRCFKRRIYPLRVYFPNRTAFRVSDFNWTINNRFVKTISRVASSPQLLIQDGSVKAMLSIRYHRRLWGLYDASRDRYLSNLYNGSSVPRPPCQVNIGVTFTCGFVLKTVRLELRKASDNSLVVRRDEFFHRICYSVTMVLVTFCQEVFSLANTS